MSTEGQRLRDRGEAQLSMASLWDDWPSRADRAIEYLATTGRDFDAESIRDLCGDPGRPNLLGARILAAARKGIIRRVGFRPATRPEAHARHVAVWRGVSGDGGP